MTKKVFLGGTANNSTWRGELIPLLQIDYFNPIVPLGTWTSNHMIEENKEKESSDWLLYVVTKEMLGFYTIAEVVDDSNKYSKKTIFCYLEEGFSEDQITSLKAISQLVKANGAQVFTSLEEVAEHLNKEKEEIKIEQPIKIKYFK